MIDIRGINFLEVQMFSKMLRTTGSARVPSSDDYFRCLVLRFDRLISLKITVFNMDADESQTIQLQLLLDQAPCLYCLKF